MIEELKVVEQAVLEEFRRLHDQGGVLGALGVSIKVKIREESLLYERRKRTGELPIVASLPAP